MKKQTSTAGTAVIPANPVSIGWGRADISTTEPVEIPGQMHMRISQGVLDPVTVNALVIESGDDCVIFLSIDIVDMRAAFVKSLRDKIRSAVPDIPVEKIIISATHTHAGGNISPGEGDYRPCDVPHMSGFEYRDFVIEQCAKAVADAWQNRTPGGMAWGYGYAVAGHPRRVIYSVDKGGGDIGFAENGHAIIYGNTNDPEFSHFETGADPFIHFVYTFDTEGNLNGALVNVPCPSQNSEAISMLSADFWHDVRVALRAEFGDIGILPQCGGAGDLAPRILFYKDAQKRRFQLKYGDLPLHLAERRDIAERIAASFKEVLEWAKKDIRFSVPVQHQTVTINLPRQPISKLQYETEKNNLATLLQQQWATDGTPLERLTHDSRLEVLRRRCKSIIKRYETYDSDPFMPMELHAVSIGEVAFVSNVFELYSDFMHRIQARSPFNQTIIVQLAGSETGEYGGYLPTEQAEFNKSYGAIPYSGLIGHEGGAVLVEESLKALRQVLPADGRIELKWFEGSPYGVMEYSNPCPPRLCTGITAPANGSSVMSVNFPAPAALAGKEAVLVLEGQTCDKPDIPPVPIRLTLNGTVIFEGSCGFIKYDWSVREFDIPAGLLKKVDNTLIMENLSDAVNPTGGWLLISEVTLAEK